MSYDSRCYDLAATFLEDVENIDHEKAWHELAQLIQTTIHERRSRLTAIFDDMEQAINAMEAGL